MKIKISKRDTNDIPMIGLRDADFLPSGGACNSGITLDFSAVQKGTSGDIGVPFFNYIDDDKNKSQPIDINNLENEADHCATLIVYIEDGDREEKYVGELNELRKKLNIINKMLDKKTNSSNEANDKDNELKYLASQLTNNWWADKYRIKISGHLWENAGVLFWPFINKVQLTRMKQKSDGSWEEVSKIVDANDELKIVPIEVNYAEDDTRARGSMVGVRDEGFELKHVLDSGGVIASIVETIEKKAYPDYPAYNNPELYTGVCESPMANVTPAFDLFNTYYVDDIIETVEDISDDFPYDDEVIDTQEEQEEIEENKIFVLPLSDLLTSKKSIVGVLNDILRGNTSKSHSLPLYVWKLEDARYLLVDGQHRFVEYLLVGEKNTEVKQIGEGYTDYWQEPSKAEQFNYTNSRFGGLENFISEKRLLSMVNELEKTASSDKDKKLSAIIVKGNPKYITNNKLADEFYDDIKNHLEKNGYDVSFDAGMAHTTPKKADLWIGHSKGVNKLSHYDKDDIKLLAFGALHDKDDNKNIIFVNHSKDEELMKACQKKYEPKKCNGVIDEHFIFTDEMKTAINKITNELNKEKQIKQGFLKTAISYDPHPIIQELIRIPQVKSLIEQHASGYVDKIIITTPSADFQQVKQQNPDTNFQPISGNPFGHMFVSEDPATHQKKPLDKIVRIDRPTDLYGTLSTILHETIHHKNPTWSETQVEAEAQNLANSVKQHLTQQKQAAKKNEGGKNAEKDGNKANMLFVKNSLYSIPMVQCDVANTYQKQITGLQSYNSLRPDAGLLFPYSISQSLNFWMGKVAFPIDIIFANDDTIVKIYRNCLPNSQEIYSCGSANRVIEVVSSFCAFHDINVGDRIFNADDKEESFAKHILERIVDIKIKQQEDLDMTDWNIKIVMKQNPDNKHFLRVDWAREDYRIKKADLIVNPDPILIREALKELSLEKLVRHSLLHILAGEKNELPEEKEEELITSKLFNTK